jgi:hypothetical protein
MSKTTSFTKPEGVDGGRPMGSDGGGTNNPAGNLDRYASSVPMRVT